MGLPLWNQIEIGESFHLGSLMLRPLRRVIRINSLTSTAQLFVVTASLLFTGICLADPNEFDDDLLQVEEAIIDSEEAQAAAEDAKREAAEERERALKEKKAALLKERAAKEEATRAIKQEEIHISAKNQAEKEISAAKAKQVQAKRKIVNAQDKEQKALAARQQAVQEKEKVITETGVLVGEAQKWDEKASSAKREMELKAAELKRAKEERRLAEESLKRKKKEAEIETQKKNAFTKKTQGEIAKTKAETEKLKQEIRKYDEMIRKGNFEKEQVSNELKYQKQKKMTAKAELDAKVTEYDVAKIQSENQRDRYKSKSGRTPANFSSASFSSRPLRRDCRLKDRKNQGQKLFKKGTQVRIQHYNSRFYRVDNGKNSSDFFMDRSCF